MRPPLLYVGIGQKRTGKSKRTIDILRSMAANGRKVLIFDTQNEYSDRTLYPDIRTLPYTSVGLFSAHPEISIRRIPPFILHNGEEMTPDQKADAVLHILRYYRDGALLLEDLNDYVYDYMPGDIVGKILSQRHKGLDIIMHFHSLGAVQKKLWRHINVLRLHKCQDAVVDNRDKFPERFELFKLAENIVNDQFYQDNKYFSVEIIMDTQKICGDFADADRDKAIEDYLRLQYSRLIQPYLKQVGGDGSRQYTAAAAFEKETDRIRTTYF